MLKLIYLARRKPGFTVDEFVRRWRKHGALGMEQAIWRHAIGYNPSTNSLWILIWARSDPIRFFATAFHSLKNA